MTGEFPAQKASNAENVSIWWRHHGISISIMGLTTSLNNENDDNDDNDNDSDNSINNNPNNNNNNGYICKTKKKSF